MVKDKKLQNKKITKLKALSFKQAVAYSKTRKGEEFHPKYFQDKERFIDMMVSQIRLEKALNKYWLYYYKGLKEGIDLFDLENTDIPVKDLIKDIHTVVTGQLSLEEILRKHLDSAYQYGAQTARDELKQDDDKLNTVITKAYFNRIQKDAKQIDQTTQKIVIDVLEKEREFQNRKKQVEAAEGDGFFKRLKDRIVNFGRSELITDTETIGVFGVAKKVVSNFFSRFQKVQKRWLAISDKRTCKFCIRADSKDWVGHKFKYSVQFGLVAQPPAHGRCRCYMETRIKP